MASLFSVPKSPRSQLSALVKFLAPIERGGPSDPMDSSDPSDSSDSSDSSDVNERGYCDVQIKQQRYLYCPLVPGRKDFRVVVLHPASDFSADIECSLKHVSFEDATPYETLSYVWGNVQHCASISLDGKSLPITRNLDKALRHLRRVTGTRTLWVDAICIDQRNIMERNQQVVLMKRIYSTCISDLLWLGKATKTLTRALEVIAQLQRSDTETINKGKPAVNVLKRKDRAALHNLLVRQPIWHRIWIMQEIACAPKVILVLGLETLDWAILARLLDNEDLPDAYHGPFRHVSRNEYFATDTFKVVQTIEHQREAIRRIGTPRHESRLIDVLARFRNANATDPRDKIYGLLGLASDGLEVHVDYSQSVQDVYVNFFHTFVNRTKDLDLICQNPWGVPNAEARSQGLPSWCPDFSKGGEETLLFAQRSIFNAGNKSCKVPCTITNGTHLKLDGISLGYIPTTRIHGMEVETSFLDAPLHFPGYMCFALNSYPEELLDEDSGGKPAIYAATGEPLFDAYWRTLIADCYVYPTQRLTSSLLASHRAIFHIWRKAKHAYDSGSVQEMQDREIDARIADSVPEVGKIEALKKMSYKWRFTVTDTGFYSLVPKQARAGDEVLVLHGGKVPMVLRPVRDISGNGEACYEVIGGAYVHGFMDGQAAQWAERGELEEGIFTLI